MSGLGIPSPETSPGHRPSCGHAIHAKLRATFFLQATLIPVLVFPRFSFIISLLIGWTALISHWEGIKVRQSCPEEMHLWLVTYRPSD